MKQIFRYSRLNCFQLKGYFIVYNFSCSVTKACTWTKIILPIVSPCQRAVRLLVWQLVLDSSCQSWTQTQHISLRTYLRRLQKIAFSLLKYVFLMEDERVSKEPSVWRAVSGNSPDGQNIGSLQVLLYWRTQSPADKHPDMRKHSFWRAN